MRNRFYILATLAVVLVFSPTASATLQLTLSSGGTTLTLNDCTLGSAAACILGGFTDVNGAAGQITYIGSVGNWSLNVSTGTVGTNPLIDLNSVNTLGGTSGTGANALTVMFSGTNFTGAGPFTSSVGGTLAAGHSLTYQGYVNANNTLNGTTTPIGSLLSFSNPPANFSGSVSGGSATGLFSLTQVVVLSGTASGTSSFDASIDAVPEPVSVSLLGGVLLLTATALRRKLRRAA
jgi:hypothetical protein